MPKVYVSTIIDSPAERVWACLRDFNAVPSYLDSLESSQIEDGKCSDQIGAVRAVIIRGEGQAREQLLAMSDLDRSLSYALLEGHSLPIANYISTLRVLSVTDLNKAFVEWGSTFDMTNDELDMMVAHITGAYQHCFEGLRKLTA